MCMCTDAILYPTYLLPLHYGHLYSFILEFCCICHFSRLVDVQRDAIEPDGVAMAFKPEPCDSRERNSSLRMT